MADSEPDGPISASQPEKPPSPHSPPPVSTGQSLIPRTPQDIAITICCLGIIAFFFAPWVNVYESVSGAKFARDGKNGFLLWAIPLLALAMFVFHKHRQTRKWLGTLTPIAAWCGIGLFLDDPAFQGIRSLGWGATLTLFSSLGLLGFSGERRFTAPVDLVVKKLGSRKAEIYSHWGSLTPEVHFSAEEFCAKLETAVRAKDWPGVEVFRVPYSEAGLLSHKREYLRIIRQRHLFDVCASTFGKDYFFTLREGQIPAVVDVRAALMVLLSSLLLLSVLVHSLGTYGGLFATLFVLLFAAWFLFNILKMGMTKLDTALMQLPALGPIYEAYFRPDTYFQQDTRMVFLQSVSELVKKQVEETTSAKGIKFIDCFEKQPVLDGIYKRSRLKVGPMEA
jgi:hypothetical protein